MNASRAPAQPSASRNQEDYPDIGIVRLTCDAQGAITAMPPSQSSDDLVIALWASSLFRRWLQQAIAECSERSAAGLGSAATEAARGLWLVVMPFTSRRRITGYEIAILIGAEFLQSEELAALCQSAGGMDAHLCCTRLAAMPSVSRADVARIALLLQVEHDQRAGAQQLSSQLESVSAQLAESYEEMNLLYTMTQNMTVQEPPERFIQQVCRELLTTLRYAWIGMRMSDENPRLKRLAGRFFVAGNIPQPLPALRTLTKRLFPGAASGQPIVLQPAANTEDSEYAALGSTVIVQPVMDQGRVLGLLIAGEKHGPDNAASSIDIKLLSAAATHMTVFLENAALYDDLNAMFLGTLEALTASIDAKDRYTCGHSRRVSHLTQLLAAATGMDEHTVGRCRIAGLVHDVGKIGVPESVLLKPGKLDDNEFAWIKKHPEIGHRILKDIPQLSDVLPGVLHHHERWDGRGYPHGLKGDSIPLMARLIGLADSFDAMSSTRTYRSALSRERVLEEIRNCAGTQFDPELAPIFVALDFAEYDRLMQAHQAAESALERKAA